MAEGVKLYSQETWRLVTMGRGVELVEENIEGVVKFYVGQSQASNHAVREAACACIAELGTKVRASMAYIHTYTCLENVPKFVDNIFLNLFK